MRNQIDEKMVLSVEQESRLRSFSAVRFSSCTAFPGPQKQRPLLRHYCHLCGRQALCACAERHLSRLLARLDDQAAALPGIALGKLVAFDASWLGRSRRRGRAQQHSVVFVVGSQQAPGRSGPPVAVGRRFGTTVSGRALPYLFGLCASPAPPAARKALFVDIILQILFSDNVEW